MLWFRWNVILICIYTTADKYLNKQSVFSKLLVFGASEIEALLKNYEILIKINSAVYNGSEC